MKAVRYGIVLVALVCGAALTAQEPQPATVLVLTDVQKLTVVNKIQAAQMAAKDASAETLAPLIMARKAIDDAIAARQQAAAQADRAANEYYQSLQKPGFTLDPQTWTYTPAAKGGGV